MRSEVTKAEKEFYRGLKKKEFGVSTLFLLERVVWICLRQGEINEKKCIFLGRSDGKEEEMKVIVGVCISSIMVE